MSQPAPRRFVFLLSSARPGGNSAQLAQRAALGLEAPATWLDLAQLDLPAFADPRPGAAPGLPTGDLARVTQTLLAASDICFVAPVYWYALPAPAKLLLDHWSGFLDQPQMGFAGAMRGKGVWLVTTRADPDPTVPHLPEAMLRRSVDWLGMRWRGALHGIADAPGEITQDDSFARAPQFFRQGHD
ncbi:MAG: NAD(P)H-dependent oxidoreductase [Cypionkella sp.]|jgi:NAD(P)H-dependent FMN reductase|nr:NAD(P)H-dependent oxidoreductase [Cypionkella sp.]